jgi:hypothetical protein
MTAQLDHETIARRERELVPVPARRIPQPQRDEHKPTSREVPRRWQV